MPAKKTTRAAKAMKATKASQNTPLPNATAKKTNDSAAASVDSAAEVECSVCCQVIAEGKDEGLFCEGDCKRWMHRYCAGIPVSYFQSYSSSASPFYCYSCCQRRLQSEIADLRETVGSLVKEVAGLRQQVVEHSQHIPLIAENAKPPSTFLETVESSQARRNRTRHGVGRDGLRQSRGRVGAARCGRGGTNGGHGGRVGNGVTDGGDCVGGRNGAVVNGDCSHSQVSTTMHSNRTPLKGARKVWGTLKSTTTGVITNALKLVHEIPSGSVTVKRKYKSLNGKDCDKGHVVTKWWFILRGDEEVLQLLERKWSVIAIQTAWKLEPVFYSSIAHVPSLHASHSELSHTLHTVETSPGHNGITVIPGTQASGTQSTDDPTPPLLLTPSQHERENTQM